MQGSRIIAELNDLNILVGKKMFTVCKIHNVNHCPSPLQFKILGYLLKNDVVYQKDLEKRFNVSRATISGVLVTMEKNGVITRDLSNNDLRSKSIKLTDKSLERFHEMQNVSEKINDKLIQNISEADLSTFFKVLNIMKENLYDLDEGREKEC